VAAEAITPTVMELGGNDAAVFLDDAPVFAADEPVVREAAYDRIVTATFATSGQVCMASKRLYVPADRLEEFAAGFRAAADRVVRLGDPLVPGVTVGPVVSRAARDRLEALAAASADLGGEVIEVGTVDPSLDAEGYFGRPRLVVGLADDAPLVCDEQFGPIVPLQGYADVEDVVARANAGDLGLGASVWSLDEERVRRRASARGRFVFVNTHNRTGLTMRAPFGGV
jgi:acyl-CoA reductase-like NAD-dependent aldehyde dehydrogenase